MTVKKDKVVEMHYTLKNDAGDVIDSSKDKEPMPFIQGHGNINENWRILRCIS